MSDEPQPEPKCPRCGKLSSRRYTDQVVEFCYQCSDKNNELDRAISFNGIQGVDALIRDAAMPHEGPYADMWRDLMRDAIELKIRAITFRERWELLRSLLVPPQKSPFG